MTRIVKKLVTSATYDGHWRSSAPRQRTRAALPSGEVRDLQLEHEQRDRDREDAVAERLDPSGLLLLGRRAHGSRR